MLKYSRKTIKEINRWAEPNRNAPQTQVTRMSSEVLKEALYVLPEINTLRRKIKKMQNINRSTNATYFSEL
jgi:hypothetical protein